MGGAYASRRQKGKTNQKSYFLGCSYILWRPVCALTPPLRGEGGKSPSPDGGGVGEGSQPHNSPRLGIAQHPQTNRLHPLLGFLSPPSCYPA